MNFFFHYNEWFEFNKIIDKKYENIFCYSELLDELFKDKDLSKNIKTTIDRPLEDKERNNYTGKYWTTWDKLNKNKWTVNTEIGIAYNNVGPSWK